MALDSCARLLALDSCARLLALDSCARLLALSAGTSVKVTQRIISHVR
jgi:hypothetical protein